MPEDSNLALSVVSPQSQAVAHPAVVAPFTELQQMAAVVHQAGIFGTQSEAAALSLMLMAQAENIHPMKAMQRYDVIHGRPAKKAVAIHSDFLRSGGRVTWHELSREVADATFTHPIGGEARIAWHIRDAHDAGLPGKNPNWRKYPRAMLRSRCIAEGVRTVMPEDLGGMHTPEEIQAFVADEEDRQAHREAQRRENRQSNGQANQRRQPSRQNNKRAEQARKTAAKTQTKPRRPGHIVALAKAAHAANWQQDQRNTLLEHFGVKAAEKLTPEQATEAIRLIRLGWDEFLVVFDEQRQMHEAEQEANAEEEVVHDAEFVDEEPSQNETSDAEEELDEEAPFDDAFDFGSESEAP